MAFEIRKAERKKAKIKLGISGPSGSGKTYSALVMAKGMAAGDLSKVIIIDTENGSAELYSHLGPFSVITMSPPYSPRNYVEAIKAAYDGGFEIIIVDSASHEWDGEGGCLDMHSKYGGKYQDWAKVTPQHKLFIDTILQTPAHFILTLRKKQDYSMNQEGGKTKVQKMGMKEIQREGFEYELTINFDIEINHIAQASKDRTGLFMPRGPFLIDDSTGKELVSWAESGASLAQPEPAKVEEDLFSPAIEQEKPKKEHSDRYKKHLEKKKEALPGDYVIGTGTKLIGKRLKEVDNQTLHQSQNWLHKESEKRALTPEELDFMAALDRYFQSEKKKESEKDPLGEILF